MAALGIGLAFTYTVPECYHGFTWEMAGHGCRRTVFRMAW